MLRDRQHLPRPAVNAKQTGTTRFFIVEGDETYRYFVYFQPCGHHARSYKKLLNLYAAMLVHNGAETSEAAATLSISPETVRQAMIKTRDTLGRLKH